MLALLVSVSTLSFGVMTKEELAALPDNSMASVLTEVIGPWGGALVSIGLCLSVLGAYVSWQMLCAEPIVMMAIDGLIPRRIGTINVAGAPWVAQLISTMAIQLFIIVFYLNEASYNAMVQLATIMYLLPYIFSSLYLLLLALRGKGLSHPQAGIKFDLSGPEVSRKDNRKHLVISLLAFIYSLWLIYAADLVYVLLGALAVVPGLIPYVGTRLWKKERIFNTFEWCVVAIVLAGAATAIWGLSTGWLTL